MSEHTVSIADPHTKRFSSAREIYSHYEDIAIRHLREAGRLPDHVTLKDFRDMVSQARQYGVSNLNQEGERLRQALRAAADNPELGNATRALISDIRNGLPSTQGTAMRFANTAFRQMGEMAHNGTALLELVEDVASGVAKRVLRSTAGKATLGATTVAFAASAGTASAAEIRDMGGTRNEQARARNFAAGREAVSTFDPTFGVGSALAYATADRSRDHRLARGASSSVNGMLDRVMSTSTSLAINSFTGLGRHISRAMDSIPQLSVAKLAIGGMALLDTNNSQDVRIAFRNIDRQQENLFDTSSSFPQKIRLHGQEVDTHIALRNPVGFNAIKRYYETHNTGGQFNDELRTLDRFAQLERQRDTMIDRAEARGDINARTADQLQAGTAAQSIRTGFTFAP